MMIGIWWQRCNVKKARRQQFRSQPAIPIPATLQCLPRGVVFYWIRTIEITKCHPSCCRDGKCKVAEVASCKCCATVRKLNLSRISHNSSHFGLIYTTLGTKRNITRIRNRLLQGLSDISRFRDCEGGMGRPTRHQS